MPPLALFLLRHAALGFAIAIPFVGLLLWLNVRGLLDLVRSSDTGLAAVLLLTFFIGLTFGSLQVGIAVWQSGAEGPKIPPSEHSRDDDLPL